MKVPLIKIPDEGMRETIALPLTSLKRLIEELGDQSGKLEGEVFLRPRGGNFELTGTIRARLHLPCQRCFDPADFMLDESLAVTLVREREINQTADGHHLSAGELNVVFFPGDEIDLGQVLEDEILILLPETVCDEDDDGKCVCCKRDVQEVLGTDKNKTDEDHPFAKMKEFLQDK